MVKLLNRKKSNTLSDIDLLVDDLGYYKNYCISRGFTAVKYINSESGFFLKKLSTQGLITLHLQDKIFFTNQDSIYIVDGFEKLVLDSSSYLYMIYMMKIYFENKNKKYYIEEIEQTYKKEFTDIDIEEEIQQFLKKKSLKIVKKNIKQDLILKRLRRLKFFFSSRYIAITGIDGSGKSTIVNHLNEIMQNNSTVVYMGKKNWRTQLAKKAFKEKKFNSVVNLLILYFEFWYRYFSTFKNSKVVIFDRYPTEMYLTQRGIRKIGYYILFNILFPKPSFIFYLHCPSKVSLDRKDDILDKEEFQRRKVLYDKLYKQYQSFDTSKLTINRLLKKILQELPSKVVEML